MPRPRVDGFTLGQVLRSVSVQNPQAEALVFTEIGFRVTYESYDRLVDEAARGLLALGIEPGDHVAVWATNWPEWLILQLAAARIGAVLVTVNPAYRVDELAYALRQSNAKALFLIERFKSSNYFSMLHEVVPELARTRPGSLSSPAVPDLRWVVAIDREPGPGMITWAEMIRRGREVEDIDLEALEAELNPDDPIILQYTSGTTGAPKGVLLSHRNLLLNAYYVGVCQRLSTADRICVPVPFYHCFGAVIGTLGSLVHGSAMLVPGEYFEARATLDCMERERATVIYGVPTMFIAMLAHPSFSGRDLRSLRTGIMAGAPCPVELMKRVIQDMGARQMTIAYGLTEASPVITQTLLDDPVERRVGTVGRPIPGIEVKVVDPDTGRDLPDGEQGELCDRGHNVMLGYYADSRATADAIDEDGWLHTGDLAVKEPSGYVRITGRIKDMIIRGGENVYPREIEEILHAHPDVENVQVVGVPDAILGEEVCAWVKAREGSEVTEAQVRDFLRDRLAHFKVPRYVMFVDAFPLTVTGKVQKYRIRELAARELDLVNEPQSAVAG